MARDWVPIPLQEKLSLNVDEVSVNTGISEIENGFVTEQNTHSRFPRLRLFATLNDNGRVYLSDWRGDLIAATSRGRFYRIGRTGPVEDRTNIIIPGDQRVIFAATEDELIMAAGGQIVRFAGDRTEILDESGTAPHSTYVGYIDSYIVALEKDSGRFFHSEPGLARVWNTLNLFAANGSPDNITSLIVTPFRELMLCGPQSVEQFERLSGGTLPFFRRWTVGEGVSRPHMILFADNAVFVINQRNELVRFSGQVSTSVGDAIGKALEGVDDWTDAWIGGYPDRPLHIRGQKFIVMQMPFATTPYGTKGLSFLYDYRAKRFARLYGWDQALGVPKRYPVWSHWTIWNRHFFGGEGAIYELTDAPNSDALTVSL